MSLICVVLAPFVVSPVEASEFSTGLSLRSLTWLRSSANRGDAVVE
jgi:hypothetical protein